MKMVGNALSISHRFPDECTNDANTNLCHHQCMTTSHKQSTTTSYRQSVTMSHRQSVTMSHRQSVTMSHRQSVTMSHRWGNNEPQTECDNGPQTECDNNDLGHQLALGISRGTEYPQGLGYGYRLPFWYLCCTPVPVRQYSWYL